MKYEIGDLLIRKLESYDMEIPYLLIGVYHDSYKFLNLHSGDCESWFISYVWNSGRWRAA